MGFRNTVLCLSVVAMQSSALSTATWKDPSPHRVSLIEVEPGVRVEVLEWGRNDRSPVILLAGHGHTGHIYDDFAPVLARRFHVIAVTRRGFGRSSQPPSRYDVRRLSEDILAVADAMRIRRFNLVGHSIAGDEMNRIAVDAADRVRTLVYLEAAYDRVDSQRLESTFHLPHALNQPRPADLSSPAALTAYIRKTESPGMPESEVRATRVFAGDGHFERLVTPDRILASVARMVEHPQYDRIDAPALAVYAIQRSPDELFPLYGSTDREMQTALREIFGREQAFKSEQIDRFRRGVHRGHVLEIAGANHYVFLSNPRETLQAVESFLSQSQ